MHEIETEHAPFEFLDFASDDIKLTITAAHHTFTVHQLHTVGWCRSGGRSGGSLHSSGGSSRGGVVVGEEFVDDSTETGGGGLRSE